MFHHVVLRLPYVYLRNSRWDLLISFQNIVHDDSWRARFWGAQYHQLPNFRCLHDSDYTRVDESTHCNLIWCLWARHFWKEVLRWRKQVTQKSDVRETCDVLCETLQERIGLDLPLLVCLYAFELPRWFDQWFGRNDRKNFACFKDQPQRDQNQIRWKSNSDQRGSKQDWQHLGQLQRNARWGLRNAKKVTKVNALDSARAFGDKGLGWQAWEKVDPGFHRAHWGEASQEKRMKKEPQELIIHRQLIPSRTRWLQTKWLI